MWKYLLKKSAATVKPGDAARLRGGRFRFPRRSHSGAAAVEAAVCLPVLIAVVLGSIEASHLIHVQHGLQAAAYEAARTAAREPQVTSAEVESRALTVLNVYQVEQGQVSITPADVSTVATGGQVTVTVAAPVGVNRVVSGWAPKWLLGESDLSAQCTAVRG
jgi:Flp pilus assembly protein TadG